MADLPKFLIADDGGERDFVVHCHYPKFILEFGEDGTGKPTFIDSESDFITLELEAGREPAQSLATLLREAGEFFMENLD
jgi:hypothetical protein